MTDSELVEVIKTGLQLNGASLDPVLLQKGRAVEGYMINAGISQVNVESHLGKACLCVGVNDLWDLTSGQIKFSQAFGIMMEQLMAMSLP